MDEVIIDLSKYKSATKALKRARSILSKTINTLSGAYGSGEERKIKLGSDYEIVQGIINLLSRGGLTL